MMTTYSANTNKDTSTATVSSVNNNCFTANSEYDSVSTSIDESAFTYHSASDIITSNMLSPNNNHDINATRGFTLLTNDAVCPTRGTRRSAGYDFYIPKVNGEDVTYIINPGETVKIKSDVAAYMRENEVLCIHIRSSVGIKKNCSLPNCTGIIDSDYYMNPDNKGNIIIAIRNDGTEPVTFKSGDKVAQGIFMNYLTSDNDNVLAEVRTGGVGSTGK